MIGVAGGHVARVVVSRAGVCMRDRLDRLPCLRYPENWRRPGWDCGLVIRSRGRGYRFVQLPVLWLLGLGQGICEHIVEPVLVLCGQNKEKHERLRGLACTSSEMDFFTEYGDANRYKIQEVIGKGSYGVVCSAIDAHTGEKVAIKKIHDIFEHISDAARILREIKLLRLLRHPDIVEIKHIMLPPSRRDFKDIYVVFELMESDLHQVIKANDDLTKEHYQFFLYQLLRALKYIHTANVYHRDLKPKNILANANCKLKICDFGLARVAFNDTPTTIFWTVCQEDDTYFLMIMLQPDGTELLSYVGHSFLRYRCVEFDVQLAISFLFMFWIVELSFVTYTPAIDIWSIGCIFAEVLTGKPLFPGKNVVHQLDLMTDLLGTPSLDTISRVRNEKARRYLSSMRKKQPVPFSQKFPNADPLALKLLERLLAFDPKDRPTAEEALADPYFKGLAKVEREPSCQPITKMEFEFERRRVTKEDIRELIFREILEYHPQLLKDYASGTERTTFLYPSAVDQFRKQFAHLEENGGKSGPVIPIDRKHASLPRSTMVHSTPIPPKEQPNMASYRDRQCSDEVCKNSRDTERLSGSMSKTSQAPQRIPIARPGKVVGPVMPQENGSLKDAYDPRRLIRNPVLPPHPAIPPAYYFQRMTGKSENSDRERAEVEREYIQQHKPPQQFIPSKMAPDIALDMRASPFFLSGGNRADAADRMTMEANLLQAKPPFNGIAAAAAAAAAGAHRKVGAVQFGMSRMY
ncbi:Mitogen-activated protein kinase 10 [Cocos nucifera]|uniref:Mitogen-activated protein kinase 10 n=1 Tax=Cocos nucifera TaxID=13894 RepID=A0A8K0IAX6_COCNU|nr:Mitogen-activated protein kinase 10 [Cocos nucifera]